ncbi:MAG: dihydroorotate dehydrogenase [Lachnospiraceae bacterium]|nr:dihydroorotate dehydrogenase [Lachnospiraceae bacterium]
MNTKVSIAGVEFKNPVTVSSGTFGSGIEYSDFVDLGRLGAVTTKGVANVPWEGNPTPRVAEVKSGMLNAIGLQNPGVDTFVKRDIPFLRKYDTKIIVNVCGHEPKEYVEVVERLAEEDVDMLEINVSCPNVKAGGITLGTNPKSVESITKEIKAKAKQPIIIKLSPNVTDITEIAKAAEAGGADSVSLINTITGMKIDVNRRRFVLANKTGGMSGPAVHPVAVRMVYQVANAVSIPIIGMGGVTDYEDALELIMAGATMVAVGTSNFNNPRTTMEVIDGIENYMKNNNVLDIHELIGCVK